MRNVRVRCMFRKASPSESSATPLRIIKIRHVMIVICFLVESGSLVKDLVEDLLVMEKVCELLNLKVRTNKVLGWRNLGARLKIKKDILDVLSPPEEDLECPTEALIRHLGSWKPYLKIADFIRALHKIDRLDVIDVLKDYLPGRRIINQRS